MKLDGQHDRVSCQTLRSFFLSPGPCTNTLCQLVQRVNNPILYIGIGDGRLIILASFNS